MNRRGVRAYLLCSYLIPVALSVLMMAAVHPGDASPGDRVAARYSHDLQALRDAVDRVLSMTTGDSSAGRIRSAFVDARTAYKRVEFLLGTTDPQALEFIDGPIVSSIDASTPRRRVIEPEGMQVIESMLYRSGEFDRGGIVDAVQRLRSRIDEVIEVSKHQSLTDRMIFESARTEIVRIVALGITGFDSPIAHRSMVESADALQAVSDAITTYSGRLTELDSALSARVVRRCDAAVAYLRSRPDFARFDRAAFIREYADPLYGDLLDAHHALGIETYAETTRLTRAVRYEARSIFSPEFLDPYFYSPDPRDAADSSVVELGRTLFFDPILSGGGRSCSSCHRPERAFTDGLARSLPSDGTHRITRNAPTLIDAAFASEQFDDGRAESLERQIDMVLLNGFEMNTTAEAVLRRVNSSRRYRTLFDAAFGREEPAVTYPNLLHAVASYVRTLVCFDSPFDRYMRREDSSIDPAAVRGFNLFMGRAGCGGCHFVPVFNGTEPPLYIESEFEVLGTPASDDTASPRLDPDPGRGAVFGDTIHAHAFKTPTIRNAARTAPYMHNGVFATLRAVVDFYDRGGGRGLGYAVTTQTLSSEPLDLSEREKRDLVAFIESLTDTSR